MFRHFRNAEAVPDFLIKPRSTLESIMSCLGGRDLGGSRMSLRACVTVGCSFPPLIMPRNILLPEALGGERFEGHWSRVRGVSGNPQSPATLTSICYPPPLCAPKNPSFSPQASTMYVKQIPQSWSFCFFSMSSWMSIYMAVKVCNSGVLWPLVPSQASSSHTRTAIIELTR